VVPRGFGLGIAGFAFSGELSPRAAAVLAAGRPADSPGPLVSGREPPPRTVSMYLI